jgi:hypothetical protein
MEAVSVYRVPIVGWSVRFIADEDLDQPLSLAFPIVAGTVPTDAGDRDHSVNVSSAVVLHVTCPALRKSIAQ